MKSLVLLIALVLAGCASQSSGPAQEVPDIQELPDIQVFLEEPSIAYESLGRVDETGRGEHPADVLEQVIRRAAELGANGVIVHSVRNQGRVTRGNDVFGTGGSSVSSVYQIRATAIRYTD